MKVGIMTWHGGDNYGTNLQSFALQWYLRRSMQVDAEIIDYQSKASDYIPKSINYICDNLPARLSVKIKRVKQKKEAESFFEMYKDDYAIRRKKTEDFLKLIQVSQPYSSDTIAESNRLYDAFITGSDQIWNPGSINPLYYLSFVLDHTRIAYAPSLGTSYIPEYYYNTYKQLLKHFDYVSTRELGSARMLSEITGKQVEHVLDPVFLLSSTDWRELEERPDYITQQKYVLCYFISKNDLCYKYAERIARQHNLEIISLVTGNDAGYEIAGAKIDATSGPREFLWLVDHASMILTNSFHCTAFSIIFQKNFHAFTGGSSFKATNSDHRMIDLLWNCGLIDRFKDFKGKGNKPNPIDWERIKYRLQNKIEFSKKFLEGALENDRNL